MSDIEVLKSIKPSDLEAYFRSHGWTVSQKIAGKAEIWTKHRDQERYDAILPLHRTFADYATRMGEILELLEMFENRSQLDIIKDIFTASADIIRIHVHPDNVSNGMVGIDEGVELVHHARELIIAAACSTQQKRAVFSSRKPKEALAYARAAKFGQTEHGSYVITIVSPIAGTDMEDQNNILFQKESFSRRVVENLASAVQEVKITSIKAATIGRISVFDDSIWKGVSANLCDAIVGISNVSPADGVSFTFSWAAEIPTTHKDYSSIKIPSDSVNIIRDAARHFRMTSPKEDYRVEGVVVALRRTPASAVGRVTLAAVINDQPRYINMDLDDNAYEKARQAHKEHQPVYCFGELVKEGRSFYLRQVRGFSIDDEGGQDSLF